MALAWGFTRTELVDAVVAGLIAGSTDAGARVYKQKTSAVDPLTEDMPQILVWSGASSDQNILDACTTPAEYEKTWAFTCDLQVVLGAQVTDATLDEALDTLEEQVRTVIQGGVTWSAGLDSFMQVESASAFYADPSTGGAGKTAKAALTFSVTSMIKYG
jgi:hypothetical protein